MAERIRVLVVDDHPLITQALAFALGRHPDLHVVGVAGSAAEATQRAAETRPDVLLVDIYLPDGTGVEMAATVRRQLPDVAIVVLTGDDSEEKRLAAVQAGACGYLLKSQSPDEIIAAVQRAAAGEMLIPATTLATLLGRQAERAQHDATRAALRAALTPREHEVLRLLAQGLDNSVIAAHLVVNLTTVRTHVRNVLRKLDAHSKLEAVARATQFGLLD